MEGCIDDISLGVFFALELYRYVFAGLLMYAEHPLFRPTQFPVLIPRFCQYALKKTVHSVCSTTSFNVS